MMSFMHRAETANPRNVLDRLHPPNTDHIAGELDLSSGCEMSFDVSGCLSPSSPPQACHSSTPQPTKNNNVSNHSPPYKKVRALRLFDSPLTPKSIVARQNATITPVPRNRLFGDKPRAVPSAYPKNEKPTANVNPFTPDGLLMNKKRSRSVRSLDSSNHPIPKFDLSDVSDDEVLQPTKRVALLDNNISRYHQEFLEISKIGSGQFGSVYKCINRLDGFTYAIKKSTKPIAGSNCEKRALNEVYAHAFLWKYKHVVRYYSAWAEDNHMIIQNEYCNGGSLAARIQHRPLSEQEVIVMLIHVAKGLNYIHSEGLVHMDIKPGNIFITKEKRTLGQILGHHDSADDGFDELEDSMTEETTYKIGDLGHVTSLANPQVEEGDCRYLPKEILREEYDHLTKADIFALGLTALECLGSGPLPKNGELWHELRQGALPDYMKPVNCNAELIGLIEEMIHSDPAKRPSAAQLINHKVLRPPVLRTKEQLMLELETERCKNSILTKKFIEVVRCLKKRFKDDTSLNELLSMDELPDV